MFSNKNLGLVLFIVGILIISLTFISKAKEDFYIEQLTELQGGTCILESGYCLHADRDWAGYIIAWIIGTTTLLFGIYLWFFDKSYKIFQKEQNNFKKEISESKKKDEFSAYLSGFNNNEQLIIKAVREQDGIKQSTLKYRTGIGKASLSLLLNDLEKREIVSRKPSGKTKEVYLRKKF